MTTDKRSFSWVAYSLILLAFSATPTVAQDRATLDSSVRAAVDRGGNAQVRVIVRVAPLQRDAVRTRLRAAGRAVIAEHPLINAITVQVPISALAGLSRNPLVLSVSIDADLSASQTSAPASNAEALRPMLGLSSSSPQGAGVGVAVIDSGIYPSADFGNRITAFYDFTQGGIASAPYDDYGHGTHVASLIAGSGLLSGGVFQGVAPAARLIGVKVLNSAGTGSVSTVISALEFITSHKAALGVDVINLSLGHPILEPASTDPLVTAVESAVRAGIVVVVAAGNFGMNPTINLPGYGGIVSPANAPSAITVGSMNPKKTIIRSDDRIDPYSSRGPSWYDGFSKPDVVAPGRTLTAAAAPGSTLATNNPSLLVAGTASASDYITLSGTSMAAAVTSGVAAIVIDANRAAFQSPHPQLPPNAIKAMLEFSAVTMTNGTGTPYDPLVQGMGAVNAGGALALANTIDTSVASDAWWLTSGVTPSTTIDGESNAWSQVFEWNGYAGQGSTVFLNSSIWAANIVWGNNILWGNSTTLWGANILWSNSIVWGNNILWGDNILWGNNVLWGDPTTFSDNILWGNNVLWEDAAIWDAIP